MSLEDYIKGERSGEKAHQLEHEAMRDSFLQDAIDGYDLMEDDRLVYHLKKLEKQIKRRTRKKYFYLQTWSIVAGILLLICLTAIFFIYDSDNKTNLADRTAFVENHLDSTALSHIIDSLDGVRSTPTVANPNPILNPIASVPAIQIPTISAPNNNIDNEKETEIRNRQPNFLEVGANEKLTMQEKRRESEKNQEINWDDQLSYESNYYTLSNSEIQELFSTYNFNETQSTNNVTPKPAIGDKAYSDYIKKNQNLLPNNTNEKQAGKVILLFNVNENGRPVNISILRSLSQAADQEAVRLLQNGPNWTASDKSASLEINF